MLSLARTYLIFCILLILPEPLNLLQSVLQFVVEGVPLIRQSSMIL